MGDDLLDRSEEVRERLKALENRELSQDMIAFIDVHREVYGSS